MPKIVILGSCRHEPYKILMLPNKLDGKLYDEDHEKAYKEACKKFYPAIDEADIILVFIPEGEIGEHTKKDMLYAMKQKKPIYFFGEPQGLK